MIQSDSLIDAHRLNQVFAVGYLALSLVFLSLGVHGYHTFLQCEFFTSTNWSSDAGWTLNEWFWFATGTYFLPVGICFQLIFVVQSYKQKWGIYWKLALFYLLLALR